MSIEFGNGLVRFADMIYGNKVRHKESLSLSIRSFVGIVCTQVSKVW